MIHAKFAALSLLLRGLGFTTTTQEASTRFHHAGTGTTFLYPAYAEDEEVAATDLVGTRYVLDFKGLMPREEFDERLRGVSVAG